MGKRMVYTVILLAFCLSFGVVAYAEMSSLNYRIPTSVLSGGGAPMTSDNYQTDATVGQPSPLMDPADSPYSTNYDLYPEMGIGGWVLVSNLGMGIGVGIGVKS